MRKPRHALQETEQTLELRKRTWRKAFPANRQDAKKRRTSQRGSVASPPAPCNPALERPLSLNEYVAQSGGKCLRLTLSDYITQHKTTWDEQNTEHILGEGTYGTVMLIKSEGSGKLAVCKRFKRRSSDQSVESEICMADFLVSFPHRNLLGAFAIVTQNSLTSMVLMPLCDESLADKFRRHPGMQAASCKDQV